MTAPREPARREAVIAPGWSTHERAVAWFKAYLLATRSGDERLLTTAQRELRALGVHVAPHCSEKCP